MIGPTGALRVMVATKPVDFRKGSDGLAALVREIMRADPFDGAIYVFRAKRADRLKLLFWDGTGVCLLANDLDSYCVVLVVVGEYLGRRCRLLAIGDAIDECVPSAAMLLRQIGFGKFVQVVMAAVGMAGDEAAFGPSDKGLFVDIEPRRGLFLGQHPAFAKPVVARFEFILAGQIGDALCREAGVALIPARH